MIPLAVTSTRRDYETHARCLASIRNAGFRDVTICCEPGTLLLGLAEGFRVHVHRTHLGQWRNFAFALREALKSRSNYVMTCEDDVVFCRNTMDALEDLPWPSTKCGCVQVYSSAGYAGYYPEGRRSQLRPEHALDMLGACAMFFRRDAAEELVTWAAEKGWRGDPYRAINGDPAAAKAADTFVGEVLTVLGYEIWIHNPSLADHIGEVSTLAGHDVDSPRRRSLNFPGEATDARKVVYADRDVQDVGR